MKDHNFWWTVRKLTKFAYVIGVVLLLAGLLLSQVSQPVLAEEPEPETAVTEETEEEVFEEPLQEEEVALEEEPEDEIDEGSDEKLGEVEPVEELEEEKLDEEVEEEEPLIGFGIMSAVGPSDPTDDEKDDVGWESPGGSACGQASNCIKAGSGENDPGDIDQDVSNGGTFSDFSSLSGTPEVVVIKTGGEVQKYFYSKDSGASCDATDHYCVTWNEDGSITVTRNTVSECEINRGRNEVCRDVVKDISHIQFWVFGGEDPDNPTPTPDDPTPTPDDPTPTPDDPTPTPDDPTPTPDDPTPTPGDLGDPGNPGNPGTPVTPLAVAIPVTGVEPLAQPPAAAGGEVLIPVTGVDLSQGADFGMGLLHKLLTNLGLVFLGLAMTMHGAGSKFGKE